MIIFLSIKQNIHFELQLVIFQIVDKSNHHEFTAGISSHNFILERIHPSVPGSNLQ